MLRVITCAAASAVLLSACGTMGEPVDQTMAEAPTTESAAAYVAMAAATNMYEMQSSQIALQRAQSADVRSYAQMMIDDHTRTAGELQREAQNASVPVSTGMPGDKAQMVALLLAAPASSFDATYMSQQVDIHQEAVALHQVYSLRGDNSSLRYAASTVVPVAAQHLKRAQDLAGRL